MTSKQEKENSVKKTIPVDLSELSGLSFGTAWSPLKGDKALQGKETTKEASKLRKHKDRRKQAYIGSKGQFEDKALGARNEYSGEAKGKQKSLRRYTRHPSDQPSFNPTVEVLFYPEDTVFEALAKTMRTSCKTYQLFDVARVILEKPERFTVVVKPLAADEQKRAKIYSAVPDHLPFETEQEALKHILKNHLDKFFTTVTETVEAPKGDFPFIHRCPLTQELLGPPNYHRYKQILEEHYKQKITGVRYKAFLQRLEAVKESEVIEKWRQKMTQANRYQVKEPQEGEGTAFDSLEGVTRFLMTQRKEQVVKELNSVRFSGAKIQDLPPGNILQSIQLTLEQQKNFPLNTANHLRSKLRRKKFNLYKKGPKGVTYVCAVKRKFRDPDMIFADSVQNLIEFLERHPMIEVSKLAEQFSGIQLPHLQKNTQAIDPSDKDETPQTDPSTSPLSEESTHTQVETHRPLADKTDVNSQASTIEPSPELTPEEKAKMNKMGQDLRWLITEGYVTEYEDGKLFLQPYFESKDKNTETPSNQNGTQTVPPNPETKP